MVLSPINSEKYIISYRNLGYTQGYADGESNIEFTLSIEFENRAGGSTWSDYSTQTLTIKCIDGKIYFSDYGKKSTTGNNDYYMSYTNIYDFSVTSFVH